jgi:hypothetical protein
LPSKTLKTEFRIAELTSFLLRLVVGDYAARRFASNEQDWRDKMAGVSSASVGSMKDAAARFCHRRRKP